MKIRSEACSAALLPSQNIALRGPLRGAFSLLYGASHLPKNDSCLVPRHSLSSLPRKLGRSSALRGPLIRRGPLFLFFIRSVSFLDLPPKIVQSSGRSFLTTLLHSACSEEFAALILLRSAMFIPRRCFVVPPQHLLVHKNVNLCVIFKHFVLQTQPPALIRSSSAPVVLPYIMTGDAALPSPLAILFIIV